MVEFFCSLRQKYENLALEFCRPVLCGFFSFEKSLILEFKYSAFFFNVIVLQEYLFDSMYFTLLQFGTDLPQLRRRSRSSSSWGRWLTN